MSKVIYVHIICFEFFFRVDEILKSNDDVMQIMAQYKKKVGDNPNQNGHTSGKFVHMCYNQIVMNISGIIVYFLV